MAEAAEEAGVITVVAAEEAAEPRTVVEEAVLTEAEESRTGVVRTGTRHYPVTARPKFGRAFLF
jgi:hypothetical protein